MLYVNKITTDAQQQLTLTGIQGITILMNLRFMPRIQRWMMDLQTADWQAQGIAITTSPNLLRQYRNQINFGMACLSNSGLDPFTINDFAAQTCNLFLLDSADVAEVESEFYQ